MVNHIQLSGLEGSLTGDFLVGETVTTTDVIDDVTINGVVKVLTGVTLYQLDNIMIQVII